MISCIVGYGSSLVLVGRSCFVLFWFGFAVLLKDLVTQIHFEISVLPKQKKIFLSKYLINPLFLRFLKG